MADYLNERKNDLQVAQERGAGKPQIYGTEFPDRCKADDFAWRGQEEKSKDEAHAKKAEQPAISVAEQERQNLYRISHGSYEAGEQRETEKPTTASMCARTVLGW